MYLLKIFQKKMEGWKAHRQRNERELLLSDECWHENDQNFRFQSWWDFQYSEISYLNDKMILLQAQIVPNLNLRKCTWV